MTERSLKLEATPDPRGARPRALVDLALGIGYESTLRLLLLPVLIRAFDLPGAVFGVAYPLFFLGGVLVIGRMRGLTFRDYGMASPRLSGREGAAVALIALAILAWYQLAIPLVTALTGSTMDVSAFASLRGNTAAFVVALVFMWISAAFMEELVFRGFLLGRLRSLTAGLPSGLPLAIALQGLLFGLAHHYQGATGVVMSGGAGVILALGYTRLGDRLLPLIVSHGLVDSFFLASIYLGVDPFIGFDLMSQPGP